MNPRVTSSARISSPILKAVILCGSGLALTSCKLPKTASLSDTGLEVSSSEREALASSSVFTFAGEPQWRRDFFGPPTKSWGSVPATSLNEDAATLYAINNGLAPATGLIDVTRSEAQERLIRSSFFPKLIAQFDAGQDVDRFPLNVAQQEYDFGTGVYLKQDIFSWGANQDRYQSAKLRTTGQKQQLEALRNATAASVRVGMANYRRVRAQIAAYAQGEASLNKLAMSARERAKAGLDSKRSVAELESRMAEFGANKASLTAESESIREELTALLGSKVPLKFKVGAASTLKLPKIDRDALVNRALQQRPDLKALATLADAARSELDAAKKSRLPTISLSAGMKTEFDLDGHDRGPDFRAGANSRWVPVAGGEHRANMQIAEADLRRAELELAHARRSTISGVNGLCAQYAAAQKALDACYRALEGARTEQNLSSQVYEQDATEIDSLVEAHENVVRNLAKYAENQAACDLALIKLHHLLGSCAATDAKGSIAKL